MEDLGRKMMRAFRLPFYKVSPVLQHLGSILFVIDAEKFLAVFPVPVLQIGDFYMKTKNFS